MTRRDAILSLTGAGGLAAGLTGCNLESVHRAEAQLADRLARPGTGVQFTALPEVVRVIVLSSYQASPQQVQVVQQRARRAAAVVRQRRASTSGGGSGKKPAAKIPSKILVDVPPKPGEASSNQVMVADANTGNVVNNTVLVVQNTPAKNDIALVANTTALYVGNGAL